MKQYTDSNFTNKQIPSSQSLNAFNQRVSNSFSLFGSALSNLFETDKVIDSGNRDIDKVYFYDQSASSYTDYTEEANRNQYPLYPEVTVTTNDYTYYGYRDIIGGLRFEMGSAASSNIGLSVQYYNNSWVTVTSLIDKTAGFTNTLGNLQWATHSMTDWVKEDLNTILSVSNVDAVDRYWIRLSQSNSYDWRIKQGNRSSGTTNELEVTPINSPDMAVSVHKGFAFINSKLTSVDAETQVAISAPASNSRYSIIQLGDDGILSVKNGVVATSPSVPSTDTDNIKLSEIIVSASTTQITTSDIIDTREYTEIPKQKYYKPQYFANGDTTPDVTTGDLWITGNTALTTISDFTGNEGQTIRVLFNDSYTVLINNGGPAVRSMASGNYIECTRINSSWYCDYIMTSV